MQDRKRADVWLGVNAVGINIYPQNNRMTPDTQLRWNNIKNVSFSDTKVP